MEGAARSALDSFGILATSGILLWSKKYSPVNANVVNSFTSDVLTEDRVQPGSDGKCQVVLQGLLHAQVDDRQRPRPHLHRRLPAAAAADVDR